MQAAESLGNGEGRTAPAAPVHDETFVSLLLSSVTRSILLSTMGRAKSVEDISRAVGIPISTCYERVRELLDHGILRREGILITKAGMMCALYRAAAKSFQVKVGIDGTEVAISPYKDELGNLRSGGEVFVKSAKANPYPVAVWCRRSSRRHFVGANGSVS